MIDIFEKLAKVNGFDSLEEMNKLIASVDLSTFNSREIFKDWKKKDGSKSGLLKLFPNLLKGEK